MIFVLLKIETFPDTQFVRLQLLIHYSTSYFILVCNYKMKTEIIGCFLKQSNQSKHILCRNKYESLYERTAFEKQPTSVLFFEYSRRGLFLVEDCSFWGFSLRWTKTCLLEKMPLKLKWVLKKPRYCLKFPTFRTTSSKIIHYLKSPNQPSKSVYSLYSESTVFSLKH